LKYGELTRRLRALGVRLAGQRRRHEMWYNRFNGRFSYIPRHRGEIPTGTLNKILSDLGISREDFERGAPHD
jgi:predicted RNA binding protein YcfA (HicA-like mRNA interferase family)